MVNARKIIETTKEITILRRENEILSQKLKALEPIELEKIDGV